MNRLFEHLAGVYLPCHGITLFPTPMWTQISSVDGGGNSAIKPHFAAKPWLCPFSNKVGSSFRGVAAHCETQNKAGVPARDINALAGERAAERKANIRELKYRSVKLVWHLGPALTEHRSHLSGDNEAVSVNSPSCN